MNSIIKANQLKWAKGLNRYSSKIKEKKVKIVNKYMKICSTLLATKEMLIKITYQILN